MTRQLPPAWVRISAIMGKEYNHSIYNELDSRWGELSLTHDPYLLAHFKPRKTDVLITTAPKAGTTWMQQILYQLKTGGDPHFSSIFDVVPWLEFPRQNRSPQQLLDEYEAMPDPRVFKTHCIYPQTPGVETARIVLSSRDPRDCCVSFYHHRMSMTDAAQAVHGAKAPESFDAYFEEWMAYAAWYRNVASWWPHVNDENVLWLRYEDMVSDLVISINRLLAFLQWHIADTQRSHVIEYCSFGWMKSHGDKFIARLDNGDPAFKPGGFIRKGQVGDHKNLLSKEQERRVIEKAQELLPQDCLKFLGLGQPLTTG